MSSRDLIRVARNADPDFEFVGFAPSLDIDHGTPEIDADLLALAQDPTHSPDPVYDFANRMAIMGALVMQYSSGATTLWGTSGLSATPSHSYSVTSPAAVLIASKKISGALVLRTFVHPPQNRLCYELFYADRPLGTFLFRPTRAEIRAAWREFYARQRAPVSRAPDTLGWRSWAWNGTHLQSPYMNTVWRDSDLRCTEWSTDDAVRGEAGIHALFVPRGRKPAAESTAQVCGIVERFGKFVQGEDGWRAEWVFIRELFPRNAKLAEKLRVAYPDVKVTLIADDMPYVELVAPDDLNQLFTVSSSVVAATRGLSASPAVEEHDAPAFGFCDFLVNTFVAMSVGVVLGSIVILVIGIFQ